MSLRKQRTNVGATTARGTSRLATSARSNPSNTSRLRERIRSEYREKQKKASTYHKGQATPGDYAPPPKAGDWSNWEKKYGVVEKPARSLKELKTNKRRARMPYLLPGIDIDGDGVVDEVELQLSKVLEGVEGIDIDGDGKVTEEELMLTRMMKGKEILADRFLNDYPYAEIFWPAFKGMGYSDRIDYIRDSSNFKELMNKLTVKGRSYTMCNLSSGVHSCMSKEGNGGTFWNQSSPNMDKRPVTFRAPLATSRRS